RVRECARALRGHRTESRRAIAFAVAAGAGGGARPAAIVPGLRRPAAEHRRRGGWDHAAPGGSGGMTSIPKPKVHHPSLQKNALGLTKRDYEGSMSTLCAGCGHDSVTAAIVQAFWELSIPPHRAAK